MAPNSGYILVIFLFTTGIIIGFVSCNLQTNMEVLHKLLQYGGFSISNSRTVRTDHSICLHLGLTDYRFDIPSYIKFQFEDLSIFYIIHEIYYFCSILVTYLRNFIHLVYFFVLQMFRTFVGTNLNPLWEKFLVSSDGKLMVRVVTLKLLLFYRILLLFNY